MNTAVSRAWQAARRRQAAQVMAIAVPLVVAVAALAWRLATYDVASGVLAIGLLAAAALATWRARALDRRWLVRQLDQRPTARDSADLLFTDAAALNPLQLRQRERIDAALRQYPPELRARWPRRALAAVGCASGLVVALAFGWPRAGSVPAAHAPVITASGTAAATPPTLQSARLRITAPSYTGQPVRTQSELDGKVQQDSQLQWSLRFSGTPARAALQFHDGQRIELTQQEGQWTGSWKAVRPALYRVVTEPALRATRLYRLDLVPDQPPSVRVIEPEATLVLGTPGQRRWQLRFEARDDHGVAAAAQLKVTLAQGSGENITFREQVITLSGSGPATQRRFAHTLDLAALGASAGNDVIAQLQVRDNHAPTPQSAQSSSLILRLPTEADVQEAELEGMVKRTLPAYFRSQRQIIIDAEALLAQRSKLSADEFTRRSDAIGVDQRILRLRYGQFLGEESEGAPRPPPTSDLPTSDVPSNDAPAATVDHEHEHDGHGGGHEDEHGHDHAASDAPQVFGSATDVLSEYGHTHDHAEAATLLDPQTRATLKAALDQMWSSEGELRQGRPKEALPHAYKALAFIKEVQQAERIYLARVGPELPPIDESRRLGGKREGIDSRRLPLAAMTAPDQAIVAVWQQLDGAGQPPDLDALSSWLRANETRLADPLSLAASIEELRMAPDCVRCRDALRGQLWRALLRPVPAPARRSIPDAMGQRYRDALGAGP
ncbi:hypothetical protein IFT63_14455 [Stenotrophomonas sp. CFBP 13724]|uniref:hypothetical protein n=1 Tax=Stenotrophomonas sp. CFBP 13724 TaxID=2775298 RepID=UPI00177C9101|nr:hypothetical protein [Stenotrophomonas sp. CFBP 13724]MBD8644780.1 hypothetical protein [Stenotrophomonas sp. CFBP 13724]